MICTKNINFVYIEDLLQKYHELCLSEFTYIGLDDMNKMVKLLKISKESEDIEQYIFNVFKNEVLNSDNNYYINLFNDTIINITSNLCAIYLEKDKSNEKNDYIIKFIDNYIIYFYRPIILFNHSLNIFFYKNNNYNKIIKFINENINKFENKEYIIKFKIYLETFIH